MDHSTGDAAAPNPDDRAARDADTQDLKATEDSIRSDMRRLSNVEAEKRSLAADDPRVDALSDEAVELAARIHRQTKAERQLSDEID